MTAVDDLAQLTPPSDLAAEASVIGGALHGPATFAEIVETGIKAEDFYLPAHEAIWGTIAALSEQGQGHDPVAVFDAMSAAGTLRLLQPITVLSDMYGSAMPMLAAQHARIVVTKAALRRVQTMALRTLQMTAASDADLTYITQTALTALEEAAPASDDVTWSYLDDVLDLVYAAAEEAATLGGVREGIRWGYSDVDDQMAPLVPGEFAVLSAFSGGGKSLVACGLALHAAVNQGKRVLVHAMEMTRLEVGQRWVSSEARVELERVINGRLSPEDQHRIDRANARMLGAPLIVDEVETVTLPSLRASIRKHRPEFVVVDQIPTMTPTDLKLTREQQVSGLAYGLKRLAKAERIPILACCQLNANPMKRSDRTPTMHDLRESQAIVQAANTLVILSDPMEVDTDATRKGEIDWIVRKQRQGPKDIKIPLARLFHFSKLANLAGAES